MPVYIGKQGKLILDNKGNFKPIEWSQSINGMQYRQLCLHSRSYTTQNFYFLVVNMNTFACYFKECI